MTDEKRAQMIRNLVMIGVFGVAILLGYFVKLPVWDFSKEAEVVEDKAAERQIRKEMAAENRLTILNAMVDGNPDSEKLQELLEQLKQDKYGEKIEAVEVDVETQPDLTAEHAVDLEEFAGQLDFYAGGQKLGTLKGVTDPVIVERTIDRYLAGLIQRYGPDWLPDVDGMQRASAPVAARQPKVTPSGVPGMQRVSSGVPGMTRAKAGQTNLKVEPAEPR